MIERETLASAQHWINQNSVWVFDIVEEYSASYCTLTPSEVKQLMSLLQTIYDRPAYVSLWFDYSDESIKGGCAVVCLEEYLKEIEDRYNYFSLETFNVLDHWASKYRLNENYFNIIEEIENDDVKTSVITIIKDIIGDDCDRYSKDIIKSLDARTQIIDTLKEIFVGEQLLFHHIERVPKYLYVIPINKFNKNLYYKLPGRYTIDEELKSKNVERMIVPISTINLEHFYGEPVGVAYLIWKLSKKHKGYTFSINEEGEKVIKIEMVRNKV